MGTSLTSAIAAALGLRHRSFFGFPDIGFHSVEDVTKPFIITPAERHRWTHSPFISGHLSIDTLVALDRRVIFTNVREPKERLLSHYTFWRERAACNPNSAPAVAATRQMSPTQYLRGPHLDNVMARQLLVGRGYCEDGIQDAGTSLLSRSEESGIRRRLRRQLARVDIIYLEVHAEEVMVDLAARGLVPQALPVQRLNTTEREHLDSECSRDELLALLDERTWADRIVMEEVLQHPGLVRGTALNSNQSEGDMLASFGLVPRT